jgi:hypothetical protein
MGYKMNDLKFNQWLLKCSKEHKIKLIEHSIKTENIAAYFALSKLLLETPISKGGVASEDIPQPKKTL